MKRIHIAMFAVLATATVLPGLAMAETPKTQAAQSTLDLDVAVDAALPEMAKQSKLITVLMERVPAFKDQLRARLKTVAATMPQEQWIAQMHAQSQALVQYYLSVYMPKASDEAIYATISLDKEYLQSYAAKPELCVGYAMGSLEFMLTAPKDYISRVNELKSNIIISALDTPSDRVMPDNLDGVRSMVFKAYEKNNYPLADLGLLGALGSAPPADACRAYSNFNNALHSLGVKDGAYVIAVLSNAAPKITP